MRYRLRTLLIVLALGPPVLAWGVLWLLEVATTLTSDIVVLAAFAAVATLSFCLLLPTRKSARVNSNGK